MKPWQCGYELDYLRSIARVFQSHDGDRCLGAFSTVKENTVAAWLSADRLHMNGSACVAWRPSRQIATVKDFRGRPIARVPVGTAVVERVAGAASDIAAVLADWDGPIMMKLWPDHEDEIAAAELLSMHRIGTVISAASEVRAVYARGFDASEEPGPLDLANIVRCAESIETPPQLDQWPDLVTGQWQDHYSSYNKRRSWHAVSLRSFGGNSAFIEKPAEMSKKWRQEHPHTLDWRCIDTELVRNLPGARAVLDQFECRLERVRLMRLTSGGELTRHADITDRNAGTANGNIARLHYPLVTNPTVKFTTWDINNAPTSTHMSANNWWYLDVRKPHAAINPQNAERIHLVVDAVCNSWVRTLIGMNQ